MLTVYKASAGSGKTFRLAIEYIKHLIASPVSHEGILAVTFTNKATAEMKLRILSQLYGLSHGLADSRAYMDVLLAELTEQNAHTPFTDRRIDEAFIAHRAAEALAHLLHNYTFFRVETIDKFFQRVLRNLARELDLSRNLRVELSDKELINAAVDSWIDTLSPDDQQLRWILDYVSGAMDDDKRWDVTQDIKQFAQLLNTDDYKRHAAALTDALDAAAYDALERDMRLSRQQLTDKYLDAGRHLLETMLSLGLDETKIAEGVNGAGGFIRKLATQPFHGISIKKIMTRVLNFDDTEDKIWIKKGTKADVAAKLRDVLRPMFTEALKDFYADRRQYNSIVLALACLPSLRMLAAVRDTLTRSNSEQNRFMLSDTQTLLARMIDGSDTPFIFEKIGSRLTSIMIDEFQDTSTIQWQNFRVLLTDCLSHGHDSLIVGDVKQSIYRWRKGDWRLLNALGSDTATRDGLTDVGAATVKVERLTVNRRSSVNVIRFNNAFFTTAAPLVADSVKSHCTPEELSLIAGAYSDAEQEYPKKKVVDGHVEATILPADAAPETTLGIIADTLTRLIVAGAQPADIAIIVRENKQIAQIASYCSRVVAASDDPRIRSLNFVSDEAYSLAAAPAVSIIVDALRSLADPTDRVARTRLALNYQRDIMHREASHSELLAARTLPEAFTAESERLYALPLYQLCEELFSIFDLDTLTEQGAYVCAFFDALSEYLKSSTGDIRAFLKHWDETLASRNIETPDTGGIRLITIHKSKGLEYRHVIVPFCDWELEKSGVSTQLWCEPTTAAEPLSHIPAMPVNFSSKMCDTIFEPDYWHEHTQNMVDNLNLLYVAFTRAVQNLFIIARLPKSAPDNRRTRLLVDVLPTIAQSLGAQWDGQRFEFGDLLVKSVKQDKATSNPLLTGETKRKITIHTTRHTPQFRESQESRQLIATDDNSRQQGFINLGIAIHHLLSLVTTKADIPTALRRMEQDGMLDSSLVTAAELSRRLDESMQRPEIAAWFTPGWRLHNECDIIAADKDDDTTHEHRPDRVMTRGDEAVVVDYKLYKLTDDNRKQVRRYMSLLSAMGYREVSGYLWAVMSGKVEQVRDD